MGEEPCLQGACEELIENNSQSGLTTRKLVRKKSIELIFKVLKEKAH
jgi:hypothetical protein